MARPATHENPVKITLYIEASTRAKAQQISKGRSMSTSALFTLFVQEYEANHTHIPHVPSIKN